MSPPCQMSAKLHQWAIWLSTFIGNMSTIAYMSARLCLRLRLDTEHGISNSQLRK